MTTKVVKVLRKFLKDARKVAILALGNILRGDDSAGVLVGERIKNKVKADVFIGETAPESYLLRLIESKYTHVIIIDAAIDDYPPGTIFIVDPDKISEGIVTSHTIPVTFIIDLLKANKIKTLVIGIRPKNTELTDRISTEVEEAVNTLSRILMETLKT